MLHQHLALLGILKKILKIPLLYYLSLMYELTELSALIVDIWNETIILNGIPLIIFGSWTYFRIKKNLVNNVLDVPMRVLLKENENMSKKQQLNFLFMSSFLFFSRFPYKTKLYCHNHFVSRFPLGVLFI